jgi:hypothetical protein
MMCNNKYLLYIHVLSLKIKHGMTFLSIMMDGINDLKNSVLVQIWDWGYLVLVGGVQHWLVGVRVFLWGSSLAVMNNFG